MQLADIRAHAAPQRPRRRLSGVLDPSEAPAPSEVPDSSPWSASARWKNAEGLTPMASASASSISKRGSSRPASSRTML